MSSHDFHTQRQWEGKFFRCQAQCWYCRIPLVLAGTGPERATKDHLTPLVRGGSDAISNIVPACIDCNRLKADMTEEEFRTARRGFTSSPCSITSHIVGPVQTCPVHGTRLNDRGKCFRCTDAMAANRDGKSKPDLAPKTDADYEATKRERERVSWCWRNPA